jgi:hypothetical protein
VIDSLAVAEETTLARPFAGLLAFDVERRPGLLVLFLGPVVVLDRGDGFIRAVADLIGAG